MAEYALPPGAVRRRAVFGLLDADGWTWALLKATFWFIFIIFVLGYVPDRAYYFTVSPTLDLGYNAIPLINLCPPTNETLPCPVPAGGVIPWELSPTELALPQGTTAAGTFASGNNLYLVGGASGGTATANVLVTTVDNGNFAAWQQGPALPAARSGAVVLNLAGTPYVIGGSDASGNPTNTVYVGTVASGVLTGWADTGIDLPIALTDASGVATSQGLWVFGGETTGKQLSAASYEATLPASGGSKLQLWTEMTQVPLPEARAGSAAISAGGSAYVMGGRGPSGVTNTVFYLQLDTKGNAAVNLATGNPYGWGVSVNQSASAALPVALQHATTFTNAGAIYVIGGTDANNATLTSNYFTVPNATNGTIAAWQRLDATDLPAPRSAAAAAVVGTAAFLIGGSDASGSDLDSTVRANLAPGLPFFRLGLFGITIPALSIKGDIGNQLGYLAAGGAGAGGLLFLIWIGWAFSHRQQTFRFFQWISRGRFKAPPEDEFNS